MESIHQKTTTTINNMMLPSSSLSSSDLQLPPGFRFHPSDEELIVHYLMKKVTSSPLPASIIADLDLYKYNPWDLPDKALFGEDEWYFFTPRDRKYPNGARPNRGAASGYWKATGTDKPILSSCGSKSIAVKKALVFYKGRPPKGTKTEWIMHEYRLIDPMIWTPKRKGSMRLDDWVLCRVKQKSSIPRSSWEDQNGPGFEKPGYFAKANELWSTDTNPDINEMINNSLYNDCPMLPFIFAAQENLPGLETDHSNTSFQSSDKSCTTSVYDESNNSDHNKNSSLQVAVSCFDSLFNSPLKRKQLEGGNQLSNIYVPPCKKIAKEDHIDEEAVISITSDGNEANLCETEQSEGNNFTTDRQWNSIIQYQELSDLTFSE